MRIIKLTFLLTLCFFVFVQASAQESLSVSHFEPLKSQGTFPEFLKQATVSEKSDTYSPFLNAMLSEGRVFYGTELNQYVDRIADNLLSNYPELRQRVHCYILDNPSVNACALDNGVVLVNMGLLAQVTNEAELAFVLAHEIAHYSEGHTKKKNEKKQQNKDYMSEYLDVHRHSREQELAADRVGLAKYFKDSPYSFDVLDGIFDLLLYNDLPFDEIPFTRAEVETDFYSFPENYFLKSVATIADRSTVVDTFYTHPNISKRRAMAKNTVKSFSNDNRKTFVQAEDLFRQVRDMARFSCVEYYLRKHRFDKALYNIHVLQKQFPDNDYLEKAVAAAYYGASKQKGNNEVVSYTQFIKNIEGEMQQVTYFLSKMNRLETSVLALRKAWAAYQKHPENQYLESVVKDLIKDIFVDQKKTYTDFCDYPQGTKLEDIEQPATDTVKSDSKYNRIKQQNNSAKVFPDKRFHTANYMLVDIHQDSLFKELVNDAILNAQIYELLNSIPDNKKNENKTLVIDKPYYLVSTKYSSSNNNPKSLRNAKQLQNMMVKSVSKMGGKPIKSDFDISTIETTEQYNNLMLLNQWMDDFNNGNFTEMRYHTAEYMEEVATALGSSKICHVFVTSQKKNWFYFNKFALLMASIPCPYLWPVSIAQGIFLKYNTKTLFVITDFLSGEFDVATGFKQESVMSKAYVNGFVYSQLEQYIKGKK